LSSSSPSRASPSDARLARRTRHLKASRSPFDMVLPAGDEGRNRRAMETFILRIYRGWEDGDSDLRGLAMDVRRGEERRFMSGDELVAVLRSLLHELTTSGTRGDQGEPVKGES